MENPFESPTRPTAQEREPLEAVAEPKPDPHDVHPLLLQDKAFWGITVTQFLGAFNDNLFKQLMLLLAIPVGAKMAQAQDQQGLATVIFSLPFVLFSGYAGHLSDKFSKRTVILLAKVAEIAIMLLGMIGFLMYGTFGYVGLLVVLFMMGTHSAFFGPGKYGILPELFRRRDLPRANGIVLMTTFMAIIFGVVCAGLLGNLAGRDAAGNRDPGGLWIGSMVCMLVAAVGVGTAMLIRKVPPADSKLQFRWSSLSIPPEAMQVLKNDRPLVLALLASCVFWLVSGVAMQAVNSLGMVQLDIGEGKTSAMVGMIGLGIAIGAVIAGRICSKGIDARVVLVGAGGLVFFFVLLSITLPGGTHLLGFLGSLPTLALAGMSAGLFAIPVQVFIQTRPPEGLKGRIIAVMNQANFIAVLLSGVVYWAFDRVIVALDAPRSVLFLLIAGLMLPVAIWYRPKSEKLM